MLPVITARRDPAPSRIGYRLRRLWLTQRVRWLLRRGVPLGLILAVIIGTIGDGRVQTWVGSQLDGLRNNIAGRPEMQIVAMEIQNASPDLAAQISAVMDMDLPISALDLNMTLLRDQVERLDAVQSATLRLGAQNVLEIDVLERQPVILWRQADQLEMLDTTGARVAIVPARAAQPDLPVIAGEGANEAVEDVLRLNRIALQLGPRLRGFVRIGGRRWDVVLADDVTIMLPEIGAEDALRRVLALHASQALLDRDIAVVDMRDASRPLLRLNTDALQTLRDARAQARDDSI